MPHCMAKKKKPKKKKPREKQKNSLSALLRSKEAGECSARGLQWPLLYPILGMAGFMPVRTGETHQRDGKICETWATHRILDSRFTYLQVTDDMCMLLKVC